MTFGKPVFAQLFVGSLDEALLPLGRATKWISFAALDMPQWKQLDWSNIYS